MKRIDQQQRKRPTRGQQRRRRGLVRRGVDQGRWPWQMVKVAFPLVGVLPPVVDDENWCEFIDAVDQRFLSALRSEAGR